MRALRTPGLGCLLAALAPVGCDSLADEDTAAPPLATVQGTITLGEGAPEVDELRLALAWYPGLADVPQPDPERPSDVERVVELEFASGVVTQPLIYQANFPIEYQLDITALPPADALIESDDPPISAAFGILVAFQDGNGNETLDPCPAEATSCPDRVLAASGDYTLSGLFPDGHDFVIYADRPAADDDLSVPAGFSVLHFDKDGFEVLPGGGTVALEITDDVRLQQLMCDVRTHSVEVLGPEFPIDPAITPPQPPPEGADLTCGADDENGYAYLWIDYDCSGCDCDVGFYFYWLTADVPTPSGWPCPRE